MKKLTVKDIWNAIESGKTVCYHSEFYEVHPVEFNFKRSIEHHTHKDGKFLRCSCISNYFGALLSPKQLQDCFIVDKKPTL